MLNQSGCSDEMLANKRLLPRIIILALTHKTKQYTIEMIAVALIRTNAWF